MADPNLTEAEKQRFLERAGRSFHFHFETSGTSRDE